MAVDRLSLPGFVTAHSHAFQRALRGRGAGGDFWAWRETMLAEAARQTPEIVRGGLERFRQASPADYLRQVEHLRETGARVGVAPHSVRACSAAWLTEIGR